MGIRNGEETIPQSKTNKKFISGVERVDHIGGGCIEFVFFVTEVVDGKPRRTLADFTIIMPADALPDGIGKSLIAIGRTVYAKSDGSLTFMH